MDKLKWNALAEMHLILRERGWEPEEAALSTMAEA